MTIDAARDCTCLLVPGAFAAFLGAPMRPNLERLRALGLEARHAAIDDGASIAVNAAGVRDDVLALAAEGRRAILFGHSSGAVAITAAMALFEEMHPHVHRVVLLQTTYYGSPIADLLVRPRVSTAVGWVIDRFARGQMQAIFDVTTRARRAFVAEHPYPTNAAPTIALATKQLSPRSPLFPLQLHLKLRHGLASDGMVPTDSQRVPGAHVVEMELDHAEAVTGASAGALTERLLRLALSL